MALRNRAPVDYLERFSRVVVLAGFAAAILSAVFALVMALSWRHQPFPGFLVEPTLVVSSNNGPGWSGRSAGLNFPQRVVRVDGKPVATSREFNLVLAAHQPGDKVSVFTRRADGSETLYPNIELSVFSGADLVRIFWLPYLVGLAYLGIGGWIYRLRGDTRPGRALTFFCVVTALVCILLFDIYSTHALHLLWTAALAMVGGALISLSWRFPEEWMPVRHRAWVLAVPYVIASELALWGIATFMSYSKPWAYIVAWGAIYRYTALGILVFFGIMLYRAAKGASTTVRRQARMVTVGSIVAFTPITVWLLAPLVGITPAFNSVLFLLPLLLFPLSVALAILRLRLWEVDTFASRAFVYGAVTSILAGVFSALHTMTQKTFIFMTGEQSDVATIVTTLILVAAFTPLKSRVQAFVDREFRFESDETSKLSAFGTQIETTVQMNDVMRLTRRLLEEATIALRAESGAVSLWVDGRLYTVHTYGRWNQDAQLSVTLAYDGQRFGLLQLGPHVLERPYGRQQSETLQRVADQVSYALHYAWPQYSSEPHAAVETAPAALSHSSLHQNLSHGNDKLLAPGARTEFRN